jgi:hypothetical protein
MDSEFTPERFPATFRRFPQFVLIVTTLANAWLLMQVVHEFGHVLGGWLTGGQIRRVILHPLTISRTDLEINPAPLWVCWAGPVLGAVIPLLAWSLVQWRRLKVAFWLKFFAGFCLIANGAYLAVGVREVIGDAGDLLKHGSQPGLLYLFGAVTIPVGLWLWHGLGPQFGLGPRRESISWRSALISSGVLGMTLIAEVLLSESH